MCNIYDPMYSYDMLVWYENTSTELKSKTKGKGSI